jgi:hypothetical protein
MIRDVFDAAMAPVEKKKIAPNQTTSGAYRHTRRFQLDICKSHPPKSHRNIQ